MTPFQQEKETLKNLLKEEFNIFGKKKDKDKSPSNPGAQPAVTIETNPKPQDTPAETKPDVIVTPPKNPEKPKAKKDKDFWDELEDDDDF